MYILFSGSTYYPGGGWFDSRGRYDTLEEALRAAANLSDDWWHIVEMTSLDIVEMGPITS